MNSYTSTSQGIKIWFLSSAAMAIGFAAVYLLEGNFENCFFSIIIFLLSLVLSCPIILAFSIFLPIIKKISFLKSKIAFTFYLALTIACIYGFLGATIYTSFNWYENDSSFFKFLESVAYFTTIVFACGAVAILFSLKSLQQYYYQPAVCNINDSWQTDNQTQINMYMETVHPTPSQEAWSNQGKKQNNGGNKILIKAVITGALILIMMIPTFYVQSLVSEREKRQKEVVAEVSSKWSSQQTFTAPYIYIPYQAKEKNDTGKIITVTRDLVFLPENLNVEGNIVPEERPRSIYKVLLYKSELNASGNFQLKLPKDIDISQLNMADAKICLGITDFKGVEERLVVKLNDKDYELASGLPTNEIDSNGLSTNLELSIQDFEKPINFSVKAKLKGSEQLKFVPLSANSSFALKSSWSNPSFDGNTLPSSRTVNEKGFQATWVFSKANLPFNTVLKVGTFNKSNFAFGVTMVQPADQYVKTMRSVKYAILFIGLTFALFFIIELMQNKPFHPVQYSLVGLALIIFFTLLLSISEFILFDYAYAAAAIATILLITFYAKSHFKNFKTASVFAAVLTSLYGFIFILIRLEDTALLVGSIGLFIVLALVMYASRKINWYNPELKPAVNAE